MEDLRELEAIKRLKYRYMRSIDQKLWDEMRDCFTPDATTSYSGGKYAFEGLLRRDFYIVMATTIFVGIMTQIGILLSDITYSLVDPRIRYD